MPHASPHRSSAARSCCSATWSAMERMGRYMRQSSANNLTWEVTTLSKSLICIKNCRGSKTVPWGIPEITFVGRDLEPSTTTVCWRRLSSPIQDHVCQGIPISPTGGHVAPCQKPWRNLKWPHRFEFSCLWSVINPGGWVIVVFHMKISLWNHGLGG